jgi:hypothetical protein
MSCDPKEVEFAIKSLRMGKYGLNKNNEYTQEKIF